jgi:hypothetical protein
LGYPVRGWLTYRQPRRRKGGHGTGWRLFVAAPVPYVILSIGRGNDRRNPAKDFKIMVNKKLTMMGNS